MVCIKFTDCSIKQRGKVRAHQNTHRTFSDRNYGFTPDIRPDVDWIRDNIERILPDIVITKNTDIAIVWQN